jgi:hypothetical protein
MVQQVGNLAHPCWMAQLAGSVQAWSMGLQAVAPCLAIQAAAARAAHQTPRPLASAATAASPAAGLVVVAHQSRAALLARVEQEAAAWSS